MKRLMKLRQQRANLQKEQTELFAAAEAEDRGLTDEEKTRDDEVHAQIQVLDADIARLERAQENERAIAAQQFDDRGDQQVVTDPAGTFADLGDFARAVYNACIPNGRVDPRIAAIAAADMQAAPANFHREQGSSDGYMVPPDFSQQIWELVFNGEGLIDLIDSEPTGSNQVGKLKDESTPWGATGVVAYWGAEGEKMTASRLSTEEEFLTLHKLYAFVLATEELMEDAPRLNARLSRKAPEAIRFKADEAIVNGDGVGKPLGWMRSGALVSIAKESSQAADTIETANVAKMYSRMLPQGLARAFWLYNSDALPQIMTMTIGDKAIWTPPNGFISAPSGLLLGRPLRPSEHAKTLGDKGDIQFVDPMGYYGANKRGGIRFAESMHLFFDYNIGAFRFIFRMAGQPHLSAPVAPQYGAAAKSHFVTLDERAS